MSKTQSIRRLAAIILSVLIVQGLVVLASRFVVDIWYVYIILAVQVQIAVVLAGLGLVVLAIYPSRFAAFQFLAAVTLAIHGWLALGEFARPEAEQGTPALKVITFNILGSNNANGGRIADMLIASGADVVMLQESAPIGPFIPQLKVAYPYRLGCGAKTVTCDLSLWSRHPLDNGEVKTISPLYRDRFMTATITLGGKTIRLITAHMAKPYFDETHAVELKKLGDQINATTGPLVLGGDFNASILAPDVSRMLRRTGLNTASREPATWPVSAVSIGTAIDHLFVRQPAAIVSLKRLPDNFGSNHYGLVGELALP